MMDTNLSCLEILRTASRALTGATLAAALAGCLTAPGRPAPEATPAPPALRALLEGRLEGRTACATAAPVTLELTELEANPRNALLTVRGTIQAVSAQPENSGAQLQSAVAGTYDPATGLLRLNSPAPERPRPNPLGFNIGLEGSLVDLYKRFNKPPPPVHMSMTLGRDTTARGWAGVIDGRDFVCPDVALTRVGGRDTTAATAISADLAYELAEAQRQRPGEQSVYWLGVAAAQGHIGANYLLGRAYETGKPVGQDYTRAVSYFRFGAERGDAYSQQALARLYDEGLGAVRDPVEAARLRKAAGETTRAAARICTAPATIEAMVELTDAYTHDPSVMMAGFLVGMFTGTAIDQGSFRLISVALSGVSSLERPFGCQALARRVDVSIRSLQPDFEYVGTDGYGRDLYTDRRFEAAMKDAMARGFTELANQLPFVEQFSIEPLGNSRWRVALRPQMVPASRPYTKEIIVR